MDEDQILQSIIADPKLTDPSIDVGQLRQTTDTRQELLGNITDFQGLKYDPTARSYIQDLYRLYGGGAPMLPETVVDTPVVDTPVIDTPVDNVIGPTLPGFDSYSPKNTDFEQNLIDQGIGVQATPTDPVVAPGEMLLTQDDFDDFNKIAVTPNLDDIDLGNPLNDPRVVSEEQGLVGGIPDRNRGMIGQTTNVVDDIDLGNPTGDPRVVSEEFGLVGTPSYIDPIMDPNLMSIRQQQTLEAQDLDAQGNLLQSGIDKIKSVIPDFDPIEFSAKAALNTLVGKPISLVFDMPFDYEPTFQQRTLTEELGLTEDRKFAGDPTKSAFAGLNAFGQFGDPVKTAKNRIDTRLETIENNPDISQKFKDNTQTMIEEYNRVTNKLGDIDAIPTGDAQIAEETIGTLPEITEARQETAEQIKEIEAQPVVQAGSDEAREQQDRTGVANVSTGIGGKGSGGYQTKSGDVYASAAEAAEKSDGGGSSGGKIVCTMMNESYGFGSFRNKIWLRHSKSLAPEYQKGYHKIFLPLIKMSKKNIVLKKVLEHIAIHRTIDIRQESRGKVHLLGRVYRKILEPICYFVGKHG